MKITILKRLTVPFLLLVVAASAIASDAPRVPRNTLAATEKDLDNRFTKLWSDNPFVVLGPTRGVYLEGYGAVFTAEVNLVAGPTIGIMTPPMTKQDIAQHKQKKDRAHSGAQESPGEGAGRYRRVSGNGGGAARPADRAGGVPLAFSLGRPGRIAGANHDAGLQGETDGGATCRWRRSRSRHSRRAVLNAHAAWRNPDSKAPDHR